MEAKVLVTGGAGWIGSVAVHRLLRAGRLVTVLDNFSTGNRKVLDVLRHHAPDPRNFSVVELDLHDTQALATLCLEQGFESVFHFAASSLVPESESNPDKYYLNNVAGAVALIQAVTEARIPRLIFSSTAATYGEPQGNLTEAHPTVPINPYGWSKLMIEQMLRDHVRAAGKGHYPPLAVGVLRYFNVAGASADGLLGEDHNPETHVIPRMLLSLVRENAEPFRIFGEDYPTRDGTCVRDYIHIEDLIDAHLLLDEALSKAQQPVFEVFNVGTGAGCSVLELYDAVVRVTGRSLQKTVADRRAGDPATLVADSTHLRTSLGWSPKRSSIDSVVRDAWRWFQENPGGY